jgi:MFS family permease
MADSIEVSLLSFLSLSVAAEWHLSTPQLASITAIVFAGSLLGASVIWGPIADRYGRRTAFLLGSFLISIGSLASALSPNFFFLIVVRFLVGVGVGSGFVPFDLLAEFLPAAHRGRYLMNINYFWTIGSMVVNGFAWLLLESYGWRVFTAVSSIPVLLGAVLALLYLPESPRWLLHQQRVCEAEEVIYAAARLNETEIRPFQLLPLTTQGSDAYSELSSSTTSDEVTTARAQLTSLPLSHSSPVTTTAPHTAAGYVIHSTVESSLHRQEREKDLEGGADKIMRTDGRPCSPPPIVPSRSVPSLPPLQEDSTDDITWDHYLNLLRGDYISITIPLWVIYSVYGFTYYGAILFISRLYSSESSEDHPTDSGTSDTAHVTFNYMEIFTNACSEFVGVFLAANVIDRIGRKVSQASFYLIAAVSILLLPMTTLNVRYVIALVSRISILAACGMTWVATPELYPTSMRAVGHSLCTSLSRIGAMVSPYVIQNQLISEKQIGVILCLVNMMAVCAIAFLPETLGRGMEANQKIGEGHRE